MMNKNFIRKTAQAILICFAGQSTLFANPMGGVVVSGQANIVSQGNTLTVTNTPNAIINWQSFSINRGQTTNFIQQSASSSVLNRVLGPDPSQLLGTLTSNGKVFLINPAGILVGQGARIDVAGLVASTLHLSDADFLANRLNFTATPNAGAVQNDGSITTPSGGTVYLVAPQVTNTGIITTPQGETILAAGNTVQLIDTGAPGVSVQVTGAANNATNLGQILADAGRIGMMGAVVKNSGTLNASSLVNQGGRILLKASQSVTLDAGSTTSAASGSGTGGTVEVLGNQVTVAGNVDASGATGGGTILVGGDTRGSNPLVQNALDTVITSTAVINADATQNGNGGKVVVWADNSTTVNGQISARGGTTGGNGGFVETSGKQYLNITTAPMVGAPNGKGGTWLLDPQALTVVGAGWAGGGTALVSTVSPFTAAAAVGPSTILDSVLVAALVVPGGVNVILDTGAGGCAIAGTCNITIDATATALSAIAMPAPTGPGMTLTMNAADSIIINAPITTTGNTLNIAMNHGVAGSANLAATLALGTGTVNVGTYSTLGVVTPGAGTLNVTAGTTTLTGALTAAALNVSGGILNLNSVAPTAIASLSLSGLGTLGGTGAINVQGAALPGAMNWTGGTLAGTGILTLTGTLNAPGAAACPACTPNILTLNKPLVNAATSVANFGSGLANGHVTINVGAGGSATNSAGATMNFDNATPVDIGLAGAFTNAGTVNIGPVNQINATPMAPIGSLGNIPSNIPIVNNGGTFYFASSTAFNGPVTINGGSFIGATVFNATPIPTTSPPFVVFNGPLNIGGNALALVLNNVMLDVFGTTTQGTVLGVPAATVTMNGGANIVNHGAWAMNNAVFSLAPAGLAPTPLSGFYNMPTGPWGGGSVTIPLSGVATFNAGVSFMNAGTLTQTGTLTNGNLVNAGVLNVGAAYAGHLTNTGTLNVTAGANFAGDITNAGIMSITGAASFQRSLFNGPTGTLSLTAAVVSLGGGLFNGGILNMSGSTVTACAACPALTQRGDYGVFANKGTLNITGANSTNFFGMGLGGVMQGAVAGTDVLTVTGDLGFEGAATLSNVTLATAPGMVMTGKQFVPSTLTLQNGAIISNGGTWEMFNGDTIIAGIGAAPVFNNLATGVLKMNDLTTLATAAFNVPLVNSGNLNVLAGTFNLNGAYSGAGSISVNPANVWLTTAVLNTNTPVTAQQFTLGQYGTLGGTGVLTIPVGGVMSMPAPVASGVVYLSGKTLVNNGTVNQGGTAFYTDLYLVNGSIVNNNGIWNVGYFSYLVDNLGVGANVFNNAGTLNINPLPLSTWVSVMLNNTGTVNVNGPTSMVGGGILGGVFNIAAGATLTVGIAPNAVVYGPGTTPVVVAPPPAPAPAPVPQPVIAAVQTPVAQNTTPAPVVAPVVVAPPVVDPTAPLMAGPVGGTIGGTADSFGATDTSAPADSGKGNAKDSGKDKSKEKSSAKPEKC